MPLALVGAPVPSTASGTSINVALESGITAGELLQIVVHVVSLRNISTPSGWNVGVANTWDAYGANGLAHFWRIAAGTEGGTSVTVSLDVAAEIDALSWRVTGADATTPIDVSDTDSDISGSEFALIAPAVTTTVANTMVQRIVCSHQSGGINVPSGQTNIGTSTSGSGYEYGTTRVTFATQASAGSSGAVTFENTDSDRPWVAFTVALAPAGGTNGTATGQTFTASSSVIPGSATGGATVAGVTLAVAASLIAGSGVGQRNPTAHGVTTTTTASMLAGAASGQRNASASGTTLTVAASIIDGDAAGGATSAGVTLSASASVIEGSATGQRNETASGVTQTATTSLLPGGAQGQRNEVASGQTLGVAASILAGSAVGEVNATASGATASATASLIAGTATGAISPTAEGATLEAGSSMLGGTAAGQRSVTAAAPTLIAVNTFNPGSASATRSPTAAGATITAASSVIVGTASGQDNSTAAGTTFTTAASIIPGSASGSAAAVASGATMTATALIVPGGAFALLPGTPPQQTRTYARTTSRDKDLPVIPSSVESTLRGPLERIREAVQRLMGLRGADGRAAVLWDDLEAEGLGNAARRRILLGQAVADAVGSLPGGGAGGTTPDLTPPPVPTGLSVTAGFGHVFLEWDPPVYTQGHGHKQTNIYATKQASGDPTLYVITDAVKVSTEPGPLTVASLPSGLGIKWRIWIKWESTDGVESAPAGGVNGFVATTGKIGNADLGPLIVQAENLALGAVDLETGRVTADGQFGAIAVGYTVTQYLLATSGILANLIVDNAQIAALSATKLTVGDGTVGGNLKSTNYNNSLALGWLVRPDGYAEFNNVVIRGATYTGTIYANAGTIGGITIAGGYMRAGQLGFNNGSGFYLGSDGRLSVGNSAGRRIVWDGTNLEIFANGLSVSSGSASFSGTVNASAGEIGGIIIGADNIRSSNYVAGTSGWQARADGTAEFNGVVYSRNMVVASGIHQIYQSQTWIGSVPTPGLPVGAVHEGEPPPSLVGQGAYYPHSSEYERDLGTFFINTGYATESWNATNSALTAAAGLSSGGGVGGATVWYSGGLPADFMRLYFFTEIITSWNWNSPPTLVLKVRVIGRFHINVTHFRLFNAAPPGGIAWKLYKVT